MFSGIFVTKMEFKNIQKSKIVVKSPDNTEKVYWHSRPLGVCVYFTILTEMGLFILVNKRGTVLEDEPLKWSLPGGYLDWNETIEDATKRELWEENGFHIDDYDLNYFYTNLNGPHIVNSNPNNKGETLLVNINISAFGPLKKDLPKLCIEQSNGESLDAKWLLMSEIEEIPESEWAFNHKEKITSYMQQLFINQYIPII
jgi:ADP-ribose pyrophosphatase YjhB (NUDIX family)